MTELLAILTLIYVAYALYEIVKTISASDREPNRTEPAPAVASPSVPSPKAQPAVVPPLAVSSEPAQQPAHAAVEHAKIVSLRDPVSGEVSPVPNNYRFAKKWIKEALVAEGLLKKVYKNSELTEAISAQAKEALEQFKTLTQYHV